MRTIFAAIFLLVACQPAPEPLVPDAAVADAGEPDAGSAPPRLEWRKVSEAPPTRSNHVAFFSGHATLVFSGNHVTGPIHDAWAWDGAAWQRRALGDAEFPERKNAGVAVDDLTGRVYVFGGTWSGYPVAGGPHVVRVLGDLQRWDGSKWTELVGMPSARGGAAMTWDGARRQLVLFGGSDNAATFDDTWTYDGTTWTLHTPATHPSGRINARMAYDPRRQRVVLFSGQQVGPGGQAVNLADTWEWDGTSWRDVTASSPQPPGRGHHVLQWDPLRERVMLVGGARHFSPVPKGSALGDHWEWNGAAWSEVQVARPPARIAPSLSFDEDRRVMVLYGGFDDVDLGDLWEWNGTSWTERTTLPLPRSDFAFAQQASAGGDAVLFGGYVTGGAVYLGDTHRFSRGAWQQLRGGVAPPPRSTASLAMHADDALLFGGRDRTSTLGDCWLLQKGSADWRQVSGVLPSARRGAAMAYDPERRITVVFGGRVASGGVLADTWIFDGSAWRVAQLESAPDARAGAKLRFDPVRRTLVLLGGVAQSRMALNDAWAFDGAGWTKLEALAAAPTPRLYNAAVFDLWGRLISWGGTAGADVLGDLAVHQGGAWTEVPNGPSARFDAALLDTGTGGYRTVFGSQSDFATRWEDLADVWELSAAP